MWEAARDRIFEAGGAVHLDRRVDRIEHDGAAVRAFVRRSTPTACGRGYTGQHFLSTLPIRHLIRRHEPGRPGRGPPPPPSRCATATS